MSAFDHLIKAHEDQQAEAQRKTEAKKAFEADMRAQRNTVIRDWLSEVIRQLGIDATSANMSQVATLNEHSGTAYVYVDGIQFALSVEANNDRQYEFYPMIRNRTTGDYERAGIINGVLWIENISLDNQYRAPRPDNGMAYVPHTASIHIGGMRYNDTAVAWQKLRAEVGHKIMRLKEQQAQAAQIKADIDAEFAAKQAQRDKERREHEAREAERWALLEAREAERKRLQAEHEARERALRAEVAAKFGVSADAFDYLIDALAAELERRYAHEHREFDEL